jgi:hypothetical protein
LETVYIFATTARFGSFAEMRAFVEETYTPDGDGVPSAFMREVELSGYESGCIECIHHPAPIPLPELLAGASWSDQWLSAVPAGASADAAICVFAPNRVERPGSDSLGYVGAYPYQPVPSVWSVGLGRWVSPSAEPGSV